MSLDIFLRGIALGCILAYLVVTSPKWRNKHEMDKR